MVDAGRLAPFSLAYIQLATYDGKKKESKKKHGQVFGRVKFLIIKMFDFRQRLYLHNRMKFVPSRVGRQ